jgi:hypothetical protein
MSTRSIINLLSHTCILLLIWHTHVSSSSYDTHMYPPPHMTHTSSVYTTHMSFLIWHTHVSSSSYDTHVFCLHYPSAQGFHTCRWVSVDRRHACRHVLESPFCNTALLLWDRGHICPMSHVLCPKSNEDMNGTMVLQPYCLCVPYTCFLLLTACSPSLYTEL